MRRVMWAVVLGASALAAGAKDAGPKPIDVAALAIQHETFTLDNGLRVVVHEDHSVPLVAVNFWYHVGSRNEQRGRTGFAHLFEHFFFNGSEHYPHGFREAMDDLGANNRNGTTNTDRTNFFEDVPTSALERTLYLEADRMGFLAGNLSAEMLERERGVVQNEKRQGENQPYGRNFDRMVETMYPYSHPYSWSTIGSMADLNAATLDDIKDWYASWYGPNNAVLALAGDISVEEAKRLVGKYFGGIAPGQPIAKLKAWVPTLDADIREHMEDRVPQTRILRAWHIPQAGTRELHALELYAGLLAGSDSSPLDKRLVFSQQLATSVAAFAWGQELSGLLIVQADVKPGVDPATVEREIDAVIAETLAKPLGSAELERARTRYLADFARGIERLGGFGGRADILAEHLTQFDCADAYLDRLKDLNAIDAGEVQRVATQWLGRHHYTLTVAPFANLKAAKNDLDRTHLPALGTPPDVRFPDVQRATLANGLNLMLMERHAAPLVNMVLAVDAGVAADSPDARGTGRFAMDLLLKGTTKRDAFALADARDALGAVISVNHGLDQSLLQLNALKPNLAASIDLFAEIARTPSFPADMIEVQRKQQLATIAQQRANPIGMAQRASAPLLFGADHPYGQAAGGVGDTTVVQGLSRDALAQWHTRWFVPGNATLVVAGDVTMDELKAQVQRAFGDWTGSMPATKSIGAATSSGTGKVYLIDKPGAPQSLIFAGHVTTNGARPDDLALETVMRNFGGMATSRLNRNLRLDKHWSYGTMGGLQAARGPRLFNVFAPVQTDKTKESMIEVKREIDGLAGARPLAGEELDSILRSQVSRLPGRFETLDSLLMAGLDVVNMGRDARYYTDYAAQLRQLDGNALNAAATATVKPQQLTWIVVGDLKQIEAGVRELGYGEVVTIDAP
ncbi:MAG: insulinase family protein [Xanthomonadales bacterium]|nr:insulinase family protein [Xanthomonadales bacterium]MBP7623402.1 insulinase family protein [Xanthomonadales bacterium]